MDDRYLISMSPEEAQDRYFRSKQDEFRDSTLETHRTPIKRFTAWCELADRDLNQLSGLDLQEFYNELKEEQYARTTLYRYMNIVRQFLGFLERIDVAPPGIADDVYLPDVTRGERVRETKIDPDRVKSIIEWLDRFRYASRDHVVILLLWRCGLRTGSLRALDVEDVTVLDGAGPILDVLHRPESETPLKNGLGGERPVNIKQSTVETIEDYIEVNRAEVTDEYGREPLVTSQYGRLSQDQIRKTCLWCTCPETTGVGSCGCNEKRVKDDAVECEKSVSPHVVRAAAITYWRMQDVPVPVVSDRMDVSQEVIEEHYDQRSEAQKAAQRRDYVDKP